MPSRLRFSSKSGQHLTLNELRKAYISYLIAKKMRGTFLFRLDNIHQIEENQKDIELFALEDLNWLGLIADESPLNPNPNYSPYVQNERLDIYHRYIESLLAMGKAYKKIPPKEKGNEINKIRSAIYYKMSSIGDNEINDLRIGKIAHDKLNLNDWIIVNGNGSPTAEFSAMVDDHLMNITHVVFEIDDLPNLGRYIALYQAFNWTLPAFIHLPGIRSNYANEEDILLKLQNEGYLSEAICSYLYQLDIGEETGNHFESLDEMINDFEIKKIHQNHQLFDLKTLRRINASFIKKMKTADYVSFIRTFVRNFFSETYSDDYLLKLAQVYKQQINYGLEIEEFLAPFLLDVPDFSPREQQSIQNRQSQSVIFAFKQSILNLEDDFSNLSSEICDLQIKIGISGKDFYRPIRLLLTRMEKGPELEEIIKFLGKEETIRRLSQDKD